MGDDSVLAKRKVPVASLAVILILSLATYWFFNARSMPLDKPSTAIVVGIWTAIVLSLRWLWNLILSRRNKSPKDAKGRSESES